MTAQKVRLEKYDAENSAADVAVVAPIQENIGGLGLPDLKNPRFLRVPPQTLSELGVAFTAEAAGTGHRLRASGLPASSNPEIHQT